MRAVAPVLLSILLALALPVRAQDLLSNEAKSESSTDVLQKLLLGKVKEKSATESATSGTKAGPSTAEHLPRKATASGKASTAGKDAAAEDQPAKPARTIKPRPTRQADLSTVPRLKPAAPISASPTIQVPKPIPMPSLGTP